MKTLIATPIAKTVEERYAHGIFGICKYETSQGREVDLHLERGPWIHHNRNNIVREFLLGDWQYLLWLDMDVWVPYNALEILLSHQKDIVAGMYGVLKGSPQSSFWRQKGIGYEPVGRFGEGLIEVDAAGTGVMLCHRRVFEATETEEPSPWFDFDLTGEGRYYSEDITFCRRMIHAGFSVWGDCDLPTGHVKDVMVRNQSIGGLNGKEERRSTSRKARKLRRGLRETATAPGVEQGGGGAVSGPSEEGGHQDI